MPEIQLDFRGGQQTLLHLVSPSFSRTPTAGLPVTAAICLLLVLGKQVGGQSLILGHRRALLLVHEESPQAEKPAGTSRTEARAAIHHGQTGDAGILE